MQNGFVLRPTYDAIGRELISFVATTLREIGKQDMESPTKADETMLLPLGLAQKTGKIFGRCASKQVRTYRGEGLGGACGFHMARKGPIDDRPTQVSCCLLFYDNCKPFQKKKWRGEAPRGPRANSTWRRGIKSQRGELEGQAHSPKAVCFHWLGCDRTI